MEIPQTVEVSTADNVEGSVVWLHGLGADGHDFEPIVPELRIPDAPGLRFVFPHAPVQPVTLNGGMAMRAWYDIYSLERNGPVDEAGITQSMEVLRALVEREIERGIPAEKIVVAGFSQGGAIASQYALQYEKPLAGLMALSTYMPMGNKIASKVADNDNAQPRSLPIFMAHGQFDPVLPFEAGKTARDTMLELGYRVEWKDYPMPHAVCPDEIADISAWLNQRF